MNRLSCTATSVCTPPSVRNTFISVDERWFRTYMTEALGSVEGCYVGQVLDNGEIKLLKSTERKHENREEVD